MVESIGTAGNTGTNGKGRRDYHENK